MAELVFKKISQYVTTSLSDGLKFLVEQADGTYANVLGSDFASGSGGITGTSLQGYLTKTATETGGDIDTLDQSSFYEVSEYARLLKMATTGTIAAGFRCAPEADGGMAEFGMYDTDAGSSIRKGISFIGNNVYLIGPTINTGVSGDLLYFAGSSLLGRTSGVGIDKISILATVNQTEGNLYSDGAGTLSWQLNPYTGTVSTVSVATVNGFEGTSDGDPYNPTITFTTTVTGVLYGNGTSINTANSGNIITALGYTPVNVAGDTMLGNLNGASPTDLSNLSGTTSNLQTQINNLSSGLAWKTSVRAATTANITLSGAQTIDGVSVIAGDRVLVKNQSTASQNGIYDCAAGAWTRSADANTGTKIKQATTSVEEGTVNEDTIFTCTTNGTITINVTSLTFGKTSATTYTASNGITLTTNNFTLDNSYFSGAFTLSAGVATIANAYVTNAMLVNSSLTIGSTNIALGATSTTLAGLSSVTSTAFIAGTSVTTPSLIGVSGVLAHTTTAQATGNITDYLFTPSNHTATTTTVNSPAFKVVGATKQWATGTVATQYWNYLASQTFAFVGASTVTDSFGLFVEAATAGTNVTAITNNYGIGTNGFIKMGTGGTGMVIRNDGGTYTGLWNAGITATSANYFIKNNGNTTLLNGLTGGATIIAFNGTGIISVGAGGATFTQTIILRAGTATAGTAPMYFSTGTNLTVVSNGAFEFDGTDYFLSAQSTRQTIHKGKSGSISSALTAGTTITVTFGGTQPNATYKVNITPTSALALGGYVNNKTTTTFDLVLPVTTGTVTFDYAIIQ